MRTQTKRRGRAVTMNSREVIVSALETVSKQTALLSNPAHTECSDVET